MPVKVIPSRFAGVEIVYVDAVHCSPERDPQTREIIREGHSRFHADCQHCQEAREFALANNPDRDVTYTIEPLSNLAQARLMARLPDGATDSQGNIDYEKAMDFSLDVLKYSLRSVGGLVDAQNIPIVLQTSKDKIGEFITQASLNLLPKWLFAYLLSEAQAFITLTDEEADDVDFSPGSQLPICEPAPVTNQPAHTDVPTTDYESDSI